MFEVTELTVIFPRFRNLAKRGFSATSRIEVVRLSESVLLKVDEYHGSGSTEGAWVALLEAAV